MWYLKNISIYLQIYIFYSTLLYVTHSQFLACKTNIQPISHLMVSDDELEDWAFKCVFIFGLKRPKLYSMDVQVGKEIHALAVPVRKWK